MTRMPAGERQKERLRCAAAARFPGSGGGIPGLVLILIGLAAAAGVAVPLLIRRSRAR